jgi:amino acid transporter
MGIMVVWCGFALFRVDRISMFSMASTIVQIGTLFTLFGCLLSAASSFNSSEFVFFEYYNDTGFSSESYVIVLSLVSSAYAFCGYDAPAHMAEESVNARVSAPKSMIHVVFASGLTGLMGILALLYTVTSISDAISSE